RSSDQGSQKPMARLSPCLSCSRYPVPGSLALIVILQPQMRDQLFTLQVTQRVLQLHQLNEQIMLRVEPRRMHRRLEEEAQPLLDADPAQLTRALRQVHEQHQIEHDWRRQDRIA